MAIITIPFDFHSGPYRRGLVPICINNVDEEGHPIPDAWLGAVVPIAEELRTLARRKLRDVWRVSELAQLAVHAQWRNHGNNFGTFPHRRIAEYAHWKAEDLRCGHWRLRKGTEVLLGDGAEKVIDALDYAAIFENGRAIDQCREALAQAGQADVVAMLEMMLRGLEWKEIASVLGKRADEKGLNTLRRRYWRALHSITSPGRAIRRLRNA